MLALLRGNAGPINDVLVSEGAASVMRLKPTVMKTTVHALAALGPTQPLKPFSYDLGPLESGQVDIDVESCGICHSDLSMIDNGRFTAVPTPSTSRPPAHRRTQPR